MKILISLRRFTIVWEQQDVLENSASLIHDGVGTQWMLLSDWLLMEWWRVWHPVDMKTNNESGFLINTGKIPAPVKPG